MKKLLAFAFGALLLIPALPARAATPVLLAQRHFRGHGRIYIGPYWGWGWGWSYPGWYYPYGYAPDYGRYYDPRARFEAVKTDVSPEEARVYLDGRLIGIADDFDGWPDYLYLARGRYRLEFRLEGYESQTVDVDARPGTRIELDNKLKKIPGVHPSYEGPRIEGDVQRFWGKRRSATAPMRPGGERYRDEGRQYRDEDRRPDQNQDVQAAPYDDEDTEGDAGGQPQSVAPPAERMTPPASEDWRGGDRGSDTEIRDSGERVRLHLKVEPSDAAVYLDDRFIGTAEEVNSLDRGVAVSPGRHTVTISRPGFQERSKQIDVKSGDNPSLELSLEK